MKTSVKFNRAVERFMNFVSVSNHSVVFGFIHETDVLHKHRIALHELVLMGRSTLHADDVILHICFELQTIETDGEVAVRFCQFLFHSSESVCVDGSRDLYVVFPAW
jgi:hypothetical protein